MTRLVCLICLFLSPAVFAEPTHESDYLALYAGYFDITQDDNAAVQVGLDYRFQSIYKGLRPAIGLNVSNDESFYGYGGFFWDVFLSDHWVFTPNIVMGGYSSGDGKKLGHGLEFRSGLELSYQFDGGSRLGFNFNHISNASIGDRNPGAETLLLVYQHPLDLTEHGSTESRYKPSKEKRWWRE